MNILDIQGITLGYGKKIILENITFQLESGKMVGIIGPNGSGKSTLIRALSGVMPPLSGMIMIKGREISRVPPRKLAGIIAVVPQNPVLPEAFTVLEVVLMGRYPHLGFMQFEGKEDLSIACRVLEKTGLETLIERRVNELSAGERQRLTIARALAQEPQVMLLDEPTAHLDLQHQMAVMELVKSLVKGGISALVALHDISLAAQFCDYLLLFNKGNIWANGTPQSVITSRNIEAAYGVNTVVYKDPFSGRLLVSPFHKKTRMEPNAVQVHVIGGGGRAARIMQLLHAEGFSVSAGVLNEGDTDLEAARALGIEVVAVPPFTSIDELSHRRNLEMIANADCTIVADIPFGQANLLNIKAAQLARRLIVIEETPVEQRDFTGGKATILYRELRQRAKCVGTEELLPLLQESAWKNGEAY